MKAIGGYPELELRKGEHYHQDALRLNTARNCLEYILLARKYSKVYIPYYTCEAVHEPFKKLGSECQMAFYHINEQLEPKDLPELKEGEAFLYTNYFGLKQNAVGQLVQKYGNRLIIDNSQAFYDMPCPGIDTFYSARKFFGVPDGAYLYTDTNLEGYKGSAIDTDKSYDRMEALLKRIDLSAEEGYKAFHKVEDSLCLQPIRKMSKLTESILCSVDYDQIRSIRRDNYLTLSGYLDKKQNLQFSFDSQCVPLCYPFLSKCPQLRKRLAENRIYIPTYWPNILEQCDSKDIEYRYATNILPLPIDQRYGIKEMKEILNTITNFYNGAQ